VSYRPALTGRAFGQFSDLLRERPDAYAALVAPLTRLIRAAAAPSARSRTGSGPGGIALVPGTHAASRSPHPVRTARS
jgi:hypothetical protein